MESINSLRGVKGQQFAGHSRGKSLTYSARDGVELSYRMAIFLSLLLHLLLQNTVFAEGMFMYNSVGYEIARGSLWYSVISA